MRPLLASAGLLIVLGGPAPAVASTLPQLDFSEGDRLFAVGWADVNVDYALSDAHSVGLSYTYLGGNIHVMGLRTTRRVTGQPGRTAMGWTLAGGFGSLPFSGGAFFSTRPSIWIQPAWVFSHPLWADRLYFRGTIGPTMASALYETPTQTEITNTLFFTPNFELALGVHPRHELTLGGNSLVGYRGTF